MYEVTCDALPGFILRVLEQRQAWRGRSPLAGSRNVME
jgi:hypothetical protein